MHYLVQQCGRHIRSININDGGCNIVAGPNHAGMQYPPYVYVGQYHPGADYLDCNFLVFAAEVLHHFLCLALLRNRIRQCSKPRRGDVGNSLDRYVRRTRMIRYSPSMKGFVVKFCEIPCPLK